MANNSSTTKYKILDAAAKSFGTLGYALSSTNQIYLDAHVSKGLVFKYFKNKAFLFYAVFAREIDLMLSKLEEELHLSSLPVMEKIVAVTMWKIDYANKRPEATKILTEAISTPPEEIKSMIEKDIIKLSALSIERFFADVDRSKLRPDISYEDFVRNIQIALLGLQNFYVKNNPSFIYQDEVRKQCLDYMAIVLRGMEH